MTKKRVLFCLPPDCGGAERVTITVAKMLPADRFETCIAIIGRSRGEIAHFLPDDIPNTFIHTRNLWDFTTLRLCRLMRNWKPDIVFCSLMFLNSRVILAARWADHNIRSVVRNNIAFHRQRPDNRWLIRHTYPSATAIILQTEEMRTELLQQLRLDPQRTYVLANPIDTQTIDVLAEAADPFTHINKEYVYVGRFTRAKGTDLLIDAFADLLSQQPDSQLHMVGKILPNSPFYHEMRKKVRQLGLEERITWHGFANDPYRYIRYADCLVLPSRVEGMPNVVLDALYLHTPVAATRSVPVLDRMIPPGHGFVVPTDDSKALAEAMLKAAQLHIDTTPPLPDMKRWLEIFEQL